MAVDMAADAPGTSFDIVLLSVITLFDMISSASGAFFSSGVIFESKSL